LITNKLLQIVEHTKLKMECQVSANHSWTYASSITNKVYTVEQWQLLGINSDFDNNNTYNNLTLESRANHRQTFHGPNFHLDENNIITYADLRLLDCEIIHDSDSESSIDDDEESFLEKSIMEESQSNGNRVDEENSMDCTDTTEANSQNGIKSSSSDVESAFDESSSFRFKSPLPPRLSSLPETALPSFDITIEDVTHSIVSTRHDTKIPLYNGCEDHWSWNPKDKSHEVRLNGPNSRIAHFHPNWSNGTAGVRGTRILNGGRYYWEINVSQRIFGTSMMFGIGTKRARLHVDSFVNMLGEDEQSWGLSHKGYIWNKETNRQYTQPFRENVATTIGIYFDGNAGTLTYYKDYVSLGVAFTGLNEISEPLYPMICSTAAKTEMSLGVMKREFLSMQDRCRATIISSLTNEGQIEQLLLPKSLKRFIAEGLSEHGNAADDLALTQNNLRHQPKVLVLPTESSSLS